MFLKLPSIVYLGMVGLLVIILFCTKGCLAAFLSTCIFMVSPALVLLFVLHADDEALLVPCFLFCLIVVAMIVVLFCSICRFFDNITWRKKHARARRNTEELRKRLKRILENMDNTHPVLSRPDVAVMKYCCATTAYALPEFCRIAQRHWDEAHSFYQELYDRLPQ